MDRDLMAHSIALEVSKAYINSNLPQYTNESGIKGMAKDMAEKYMVAYKEAIDTFNASNPKWFS